MRHKWSVKFIDEVIASSSLCAHVIWANSVKYVSIACFYKVKFTNPYLYSQNKVLKF